MDEQAQGFAVCNMPACVLPFYGLRKLGGGPTVGKCNNAGNTAAVLGGQLHLL